MAVSVVAQKKRIPPGGRIAVVVDARLAALRGNPSLNASLVRRLGRGSFVSIRGSQRTGDGILFHRVAVSSRTSGWIQSDAVVAGWRANDDDRLLRLIAGPDEFERLARSRIFLDTFPHSPLRPTVLLLYSQAAEEAAEQLTRSAQRQFTRNEIPENGAPLFSYFLNYNGLDRYNRQGARFVFAESTKSFHYEGAALREILRRYPQSKEALEARAMLEKLEAIKTKK
ncbi:MAG TPA: hypothetical protein VNG71_22020 [Pyrinomonadaceae bacterium]|nr:hypothetical protein [Pyrinomonadaceae bacterium]